MVRRKEGDRLVAPVIDPAGRRSLRVELKYRQQFDRGDAQILQVWNLLDRAGIGSALRGGDAGAGVAGEAAHVHLVDDGLDKRPPNRRVVFPVVAGGISDDALDRDRRVVTTAPGGVAVV